MSMATKTDNYKKSDSPLYPSATADCPSVEVSFVMLQSVRVTV